MFKLINQFKLLLCIGLLLSVNSVQADAQMQTVEDLRVLKQQAESNNLPVLLMFTAEDCDYCDAIRVNYLSPMIKSGDYASTILFRQIYIEEFNYIRNEEGELIDGDYIAMKYDVDVTPTLLFIDSDWQEVAERIIGIGIPDYFDELLHIHITQAVLSHARNNQAKLKN